jgi:hypothetical protein
MVRHHLCITLCSIMLVACSDAGEDPSGSGESGTSEDTTSADDSSQSTTNDEPSSTSSTTGTTSADEDSTSADTHDDECTEHDECTAAHAPFCSGGECVPCSGTLDPDAACASFNSGFPLCVDSECVQCTADDDSACQGDTPLCDAEARSCVGCTYHHQCPESACHIAEGSCLPTDRVWTVDGSGGGDYQSLADALTQIGSGQVGTIVINDGIYVGPFTISGDRVIAMVRGTGSPRIISAIDITEPTFTITGATVYFQGVRMAATLNPEVTIDASGAKIWLDESTFRMTDYGGGAFSANQEGTAVRLRSAAELTMRNTTISDVSSDGSTGIDVGGGSSATVLYSTIGAQSSSPSITCSNVGTVTVRNSILAAQTNPAHACGAADLISTAVRPNVNTSWFVNYGSGNLHLSATGSTQFADIATWLLGDPPFDLDGDARPDRDGTPDFAGADVP